MCVGGGGGVFYSEQWQTCRTAHTASESDILIYFFLNIIIILNISSCTQRQMSVVILLSRRFSQYACKIQGAWPTKSTHPTVELCS